MKLIGVGGEAAVYDLGRGRALKLFKDAKHPDVAFDPALAAAAEEKLREHQTKLPAMLARTWPVEVVAPLELHHKGGRIAGYIMPLVTPAEPLASFTDIAFRSAISDDDVFRLLRALHTAIAHVHRSVVVIGDLNPFNILVTGDRVRIIDADSHQFGAFKCRLFTDRYTDPRLLSAMTLARDYDTDADWYSFAALVLECLTFVAPFGGVHKGTTPSERIARGLTVFAAGVTYPRAARPLSSLPPALFDYLRCVFVEGKRGAFPEDLLERLRLAPVAVAPLVHAAGLDLSPVEVPAAKANVWIQGGSLFAAGPHGPVHLGDVLEDATKFWVGPKFGIGFYRAGDKPVAFTFATDRRALNDSLVLPRLPAILGVQAAVSEAMATLVFHVRDGATIKYHAVAFDHTGARLAEQTSEDWLPQIARAAATGHALLVPTDEGVIRVEPRGGQLAVTARFPATKEIVNAASRLHVGSGGLIVQNAHGAVLVRMQGASK